MIEMESSSTQASGQTQLSAYEVAIWCIAMGKDEEEVKDLLFQYCQQLKEFFGEKLVVKAVEVGLKSFQPT